MTEAPEQQLRAFVSYLRDMGIYDLYRRDDPQTLLPESLRLAVERSRDAQRTSALPVPPAAANVLPTNASSNASPNAQRHADQIADVLRGARPLPSSAIRPAPPAAVPAGRSDRPEARTTAQPSYFSTDSFAATAEEETSSLPPELAAPMPKPVSFDALAPLPLEIVQPVQRPAALDAIRADIGDCTRCPLAYAGRHHIVFADGDPNAKLMFVGEGPGADEDASGVPFVGKAGQLLNNMITAMGLRREDVYIANIVKCRPPGNRTPEFVEASTCSQFLVRQIDTVRPQVIVALGSTAATYLLGVRQSLASLRGRWHETRGAKLAVTYHPAFLLRDPRQKGEAWKDLQMVMAELGLKAARKPAP